jgi:hypothetical protein
VSERACSVPRRAYAALRRRDIQLRHASLCALARISHAVPPHAAEGFQEQLWCATHEARWELAHMLVLCWALGIRGIFEATWRQGKNDKSEPIQVLALREFFARIERVSYEQTLTASTASTIVGQAQPARPRLRTQHWCAALWGPGAPTLGLLVEHTDSNK